MKIRNGFVSNSSSGSFILHWRMKNFGERINITRAVGEAFGVHFHYDKETLECKGTIDWEHTWNKEAKEKVDQVLEHTVENVDGSFTTTFYASMINNGDDFGEAAKSLLIGIVADDDDRFDIIDKKIERDY
jgi:hypothetical protein